jgi:hypothetical protein
MRVTLSACHVGFHLSEAGHAESYAEGLSISGRGAEGEPLPFEMMGQSCNKGKLFWLASFPVLYTCKSCEAARSFSQLQVKIRTFMSACDVSNDLCLSADQKDDDKE